MTEMSKELMGLLNGDGYSYVVTASKEGMPNTAIIGSIRALSPDTIIMAAGFMNKTLKNLQENPKASVVLKVEEIYSVGLGPEAGKKIA